MSRTPRRQRDDDPQGTNLDPDSPSKYPVAVCRDDTRMLAAVVAVETIAPGQSGTILEVGHTRAHTAGDATDVRNDPANRDSRTWRRRATAPRTVRQVNDRTRPRASAITQRRRPAGAPPRLDRGMQKNTRIASDRRRPLPSVPASRTETLEAHVMLYSDADSAKSLRTGFSENPAGFLKSAHCLADAVKRWAPPCRQR